MGGYYAQFVGWGVETTWGTAVSRTSFARMKRGTRIAPVIPRDPKTILGYRSPNALFTKTKSATGKIMIPFCYDGLEDLLEYCFGTVAETGTGPYLHTFTLADDPYTRTSSPLVGLTVESHLGLPDSSEESLILAGGRPSEFGAEFRIGEEITFDVDVVGKEAPLGAKSSSPTYPDYDTYEAIPSQVTIEVDDTAKNVVAASFRVNNGLKTDRAFLGSASVASALGGPDQRSITGEIELEWDNALYDLFTGGTTAKLEILCDYDANYYAHITLPKIQFTGDAPDPEQGEALPLTLPFVALYDATDTAVKFEYSNQTAP